MLSSKRSKKLPSDIELALLIDKDSYKLNDTILGFIKICLRKDLPVKIIELKFNQTEYWKQGKNNSRKEKSLYQTNIQTYDDTKSKNLSTGVHMYPFSLPIPNSTRISFEYSDQDFTSYIRAYLQINILNFSTLLIHDVIIYNYDFFFEDYPTENTTETTLYKFGMFSRGGVGLKIQFDSNTYTMGNIAKVKIFIENKSTHDIVNVKLSFFRIIDLLNEGKLMYSKKQKIKKVIVETVCKANSNNSVTGEILLDDCEEMRNSFKLFEPKKVQPFANPAFFVPSIETRILQCKYFIKATAFPEGSSIFKKFRPKCELPIQIIY